MLFAVRLPTLSHVLELFVVLALALTLSACSKGESATSSGGPDFINISGNWSGTATISNSTPTEFSLSIASSPDGNVNGVARFTSSQSGCLVSGTFKGTASRGQVNFVIESNNGENAFAGTASSRTMQGSFAVKETPILTSNITDEDSNESNFHEPCDGVSGVWQTRR